MALRPGSVLFACGMNSVRSPMAEQIAKHYFPRSIFFDSVGVRAGQLDPFAVAVIDEMGLDLSRHRPKTFDQLEDDFFDLIITLAPEAHHKALQLTETMSIEVEYWQTLDPSLTIGSRDQIMSAYRSVRDGLVTRIQQKFHQ